MPLALLEPEDHGKPWSWYPSFRLCQPVNCGTVSA